MRGSIGHLVLLLAASVSYGRADAVSSTGRCTILAGEKLPALSGGPEALCSEVERAISAAAPDVPYKVEITVVSPARLAAVLVVKGRKLPEQKFAIVDREFSPSSLQRFARALAAEVVKAAKS